MFKKWILLCFLIITHPIYSQELIENVLSLGKNDAELLANAYLAPSAQLLPLSMSEGWAHSGQPLQKLELNFKLVAAATLMRLEDRSFDVTALALENQIISGNQAGTFFSKNKDEVFIKNEDNGEMFKFNTQGGLNLMPLATPQVSIGLFRNTELMFRFFPKIQIDKARPFLIGFGIKHDIKQWIPSMALSDFGLSVLGNYSQLKIDYDLTLNNIQEKGQKLNVQAQSFSIGLIASKKLAFISVFGGVRYDSGATQTDLLGSYWVGSGANAEMITNPDYIEDQKYNRLGAQLGLGLRIFGGYAYVAATAGNRFSLNIGLSAGIHR